MSSCAGPYTRVFFDAADAAAIRTLAERLAADGWTAKRLTLPPGRGGIDDLSCDMLFEGGAVVRVAKFLGPRKLFRQGHIYEIAFHSNEAEPAADYVGSLFAESLDRVIAQFLAARDDIAAETPFDGWVGGADAHERRIELCNDL